MAKRKTTKGTSLAKGPVGLVGLVLLAYGITALIFGGHSFTLHVPNGLEVNGWSGLLFIVAGLLLLLGAPLHWGAKGMSLIVGLVLGAAALIALAKGDGVYGIFAANHLTELVWGAAAALLILVSLLPRVGGKTTRVDEYDGAAGRHATRRVAREPQRVEREPAGEPVQSGLAPESWGHPVPESPPASGVATGAPVDPTSRQDRAHRDITTYQTSNAEGEFPGH